VSTEPLPTPARLRPQTDHDVPMIRAAWVAAHRAPMDAAGFPADTVTHLLDDQFRIQTECYRGSYPHAVRLAITVDDAVVGRLIVDHAVDAETGAIRLVDIVVHPAQQHGGIGTQVLQAVITDAGLAGRSIALHAEPDSDAARWYCRHGFAEVARTAMTVALRRPVSLSPSSDHSQELTYA
jgi:GNAT superfamily N-acetyltransferase